MWGVDGQRIGREKTGKETFQRKAEIDDNIVIFIKGNIESYHAVNATK